MDETAIRKIGESAIAAANLIHKHTNGFGLDRPLVALPSELKVHDLEKYLPERARFRGRLDTESVEAFVEYAEEQGAACPCFVDGETMAARVVFDLGTVNHPGHADHSAWLKMKQTAPYSALLDRDGSPYTQRETAEWLEDWRDFLEALDGDGKKVDIKRAITTIRNLTIETKQGQEFTEGDFKSKRTAMEEIEAKGKQDGLPSFIVFKCVPYEGLKERPFHMRLSLRTARGDAPSFVLRIVRLEREQEEITKEFRGLLDEKFKSTDIKTYIGTFSV